MQNQGWWRGEWKNKWMSEAREREKHNYSLFFMLATKSVQKEIFMIEKNVKTHTERGERVNTRELEWGEKTRAIFRVHRRFFTTARLFFAHSLEENFTQKKKNSTSRLKPPFCNPPLTIFLLFFLFPSRFPTLDAVNEN